MIEQRQLDRHRDERGGGSLKLEARASSPDLLHVRIRSAIEALAQPDEPYAQRQALIDLSAVCMELAAGLPRPRREVS